MTAPTDAAIAQAFREFCVDGYDEEPMMASIADRARELDATYQPRINSGETDNAAPPAQAAESVQVAYNSGETLSKQAAEAVERVARAMYEDECDGNYNPWDKAGKHSREVWTDRARAAIAAMQAKP